jgi:hypothetical protein
MTRVFARSAALALAVALGALLAPGAAVGATTALGGSPLNVQVGDLGRLQAMRADRAENGGIFYPSTSENGDSGLFLALPDSANVFGFQVTSGLGGITDYTAGSQGAVTGSGSAADPSTLVTTYTASTYASITQTTKYVNGSQQFSVRWEVKNTSGAPLKFKAMAAADFFFDGSDRGTGIFTIGPPRFLGGTNADTGNSGGFEEVSPAWSTYQALAWGDGAGDLWGKINASAGSAAATFDGTVVGEPVDNAGAVEWDQYAGGSGLAPNATATFAVIVRSAVPAALQLNPTNGGAPRGVPLNITATATNTEGVPYAGKTLRYEITGVNPASGALTLDSSGQGVITDPGTNPGDDTIVAFVDFNNDGTRETVEPQASALATFVDHVAPSCTVRVTGDRPGGGGAGKPLVITVSCNEAARVTVATKLIPVAGRAGSSARRRKAKPITLRKVTRVVAPGHRFAFKLRLPPRVARKYAGKKLLAVTTVTAKDPSGNVKRVKKRHTIRVRPRPHHR